MNLLPYLVAFSAGPISFLAPCVLPLIPGYLAYLAGGSLQEKSLKRQTVFLHALCFVAGFASVFALLGILLATVLESVAYDAQIWLARIGGIIVIFFGVYLVGWLRFFWLEREHRLKLLSLPVNRYFTSILFGAAFAAGWTPCVGAALGSILGLAASQPSQAFWLLLIYALGFGVPFLILGLFISQARNVIAKILPYVPALNKVFGVVLVIFGLALATQTINRIADFSLVIKLFSN